MSTIFFSWKRLRLCPRIGCKEGETWFAKAPQQQARKWSELRLTNLVHLLIVIISCFVRDASTCLSRALDFKWEWDGKIFSRPIITRFRPLSTIWYFKLHYWFKSYRGFGWLGHSREEKKCFKNIKIMLVSIFFF